MELLTRVEELIQFIEWQQGAERKIEMHISPSTPVIFTLIDEETGETQEVGTFDAITITKEKKNRVRQRDIRKFISKVNGNLYPFIRWMNEGNRSVTFIFEEGLSFRVYDADLNIEQTVEFLEQIDLYSEKILELMFRCTKLDEEDPKRVAYLQEIAALEIRKVKA